MKSGIALIGFMGTGKTTVGRALAARLGREFIELDALIEKRAGRTIAEIFRQEGEPRFRELEIEAVKDVAARQNAVIAGGGGVVLNRINIDRLKINCIIVYLKASPEVILARTAADNTFRPLLAVANRAAKIKELLAARRPLYEGAADIEIDTSTLDRDEVVEKIIGKLKAYESND